jgi:hypothetical protein
VGLASRRRPDRYAARAGDAHQTGGENEMKKLFGGLVIVASLLFGSAVFLGSPAQAATCVHNIHYYKANPSEIGGPDLTPALEAGILAKTGKSSLEAVLKSSSFTLDTLAAKALIVAASNGSTGDTGFTGKLGDAFYTLVFHFEGTGDPNKLKIILSTFVLELYNNGFWGLPRC